MFRFPLSSLIVATTCLGFAITAGADDDAAEPAIQWGPRDDSGLQLGIWRYSPKSLGCVIRNQRSVPVEFNNYFLGYWEFVTLQVRSKGDEEWISLDSPRLGLYSAGPSKRNAIQLEPGVSYRPRLKAGDKSQLELYSFTWPLDQVLLQAGGRTSEMGVRTGVIEIRLIQRGLAYFEDNDALDLRAVRRKLILPETLTSGALEIDLTKE